MFTRRKFQRNLGGQAKTWEGKDRENIVNERLRRYRFAEKKFKRAKKVAWFLQKLPDILGIAVCNDLGYGNSPEEGDIDLFIITKKNRVWTTRFLVILFLKIFRLRPGEAKFNAVCPSFFIDEEHLNLKDLSAITPPEDDIHFVYWINQMTPIFGADSLWKKFYEENAWTEQSLPNRRLFLTNPVRNYKPRRVYEIEQRFPSLLGDALENLLRFRFLSPKIRETMNLPTNSIEAKSKIDSAEGEAALRLTASKNQMSLNRIGGGVNKSNDVVIRDGVLKLHTNDRRKLYFEEFQNKISNYQYPISNSQ